jgi:AcrR family transcriptional regulator
VARPPRASDPRSRLLADAIAYATEHGLSDLSLRELAAGIGTSHRMLIYHFGSRNGLVAAIVTAVEAEQRTFMVATAADADHRDPAEVIRTMWRRFTDPALSHSERLFFEIYAQALLGRPGTEGFLDGIVDDWVRTSVSLAQRLGLAAGTAEADARLGVAVMRGLLLDLLATGDHAGTTAAAERFIELVTGAPAGVGSAADRRRRPSAPS